MNLTVTLVQPNLVWEQPEGNRELISRMLDGNQEATDLILFPEMFTTGFTMNAVAMAEPLDGPSMQWMAELAVGRKSVVCGSLIISEAGKYFNRLVWMRPDGNYTCYDKRHLFSMAGEDKVFTAGKSRIVLELNGWAILPQICYDLRFPVWARNQDDYDVYLNISSWPKIRNRAWKTLIPARAIENQAYAIGVNRFGTDGNSIEHTGDSVVIDPLGEVVTEISGGAGLQTVSLNHDYLQELRHKLPFQADRDTFSINQ